MDVREKLVELLTDTLPRIGNLPKCDNPLRYTSDEIVERIADHLISHGVTVQEWISVKDRLPEPFETVIVQMPQETPLATVGWGFIKGDGGWYCNYFNREKDEVTHWMPLPEPPKGE